MESMREIIRTAPVDLVISIETDGGPWARHNMPCPVCDDEKAILDLNTGIFQPGGKCQMQGWKTIRKRRWRRG